MFCIFNLHICNFNFIFWIQYFYLNHTIFSVLLALKSACAPGGWIYSGQKCLPPASLLCCHRNQKIISRRTTLTLGKWVIFFFFLFLKIQIHNFVTVYWTLVVLQLLGSLISDFVDSFRPTARINSICGKTLTHSIL